MSVELKFVPLVVLAALDTLAVFVAVKDTLRACEPGRILCPAAASWENAIVFCDLFLKRGLVSLVLQL